MSRVNAPMPRFEHPFALVIAMSGVLVSFVASASHGVGVLTRQTHAFVATIDDRTLLSWTGTAVAGLAMASPAIIKFIGDLLKKYREVNLEADTQEMDTWGGRIADANAEKGKLQGQLDAAKEKIVSLEQWNASQAKQIEDLKARNDEMARRLNTLSGEIHKVGSEAKEAKVKADSQGKRITAIENVTPGISDHSMPTRKDPPRDS